MGRLKYPVRHGAAARLGRAVAGAVALLAILPAASSAALSWAGPMAPDAAGTGPALDAVGCVSIASCTALTVNGGAVSFNPQAVTAASPASIDASAPTAISCLPGGPCVAVDVAGQEVTLGGGTAPVDPGQVLSAVSCLSGSLCVAVDTVGNEVSFDPGARTASSRHPIDAGRFLTALSCPSASECVAIDGSRREVTFNPATGAVAPAPSPISYVGGGSPPPLTALSCTGATQCLAFDTAGGQYPFNPQAPTSGFIYVPVDPGQSIIASTCESAGQCTVIDGAGGEVTFTPGRNTAPGTSTTAVRVMVDPSRSLGGFTCTAVDFCVAVNGEGKEINFNPATGAVSGPRLTDATPAYSVVACSSSVQCTGADRAGNVVTFDPQSRATLASGTVDQNTQLISGMSCPSLTRCTLVDLEGNEVSFNPQAPQSPGSPSVKQLVKGHPLLAVSCPIAAQCTAVDDDQDEITFNPAAPGGATFALLGTPSGTGITGISCPTASQCTAVDGVGEAVSFNPVTPGIPRPYTVLSGGAVGVSCPSSSECVAVDPSGGQVVFAPTAPGAAHTSTIDAGQQTTGLACLTATYCVITDSAGRAIEFDPHGSASTISRPVGSAASVMSLACPSSTECVAVDAAGRAFAAGGPLPPLPAGIGAPTVRGPLQPGRTLIATTGLWTNSPTSFAPQWQRCSARGQSCRAIAGATGQSYRLVPADAGHRLRLQELAANQAGYGAPQYSMLTALVSGRPAPPRLSGVFLRDSPPSLGFTLTAARSGPKLRMLLLALPAGVSFTTGTGRHPSVAGLDVNSGGRRLRASVRPVAGRLRITLARLVSSVRIVLGAPNLILSGALSHRLRAGRVTVLTLRVAVPRPGFPNLPTTERWKAR